MSMGWEASASSEDCPCATNSVDVLASLVDRSCKTAGGEVGIMLTAEGPCVPHAYGTGCRPHDMEHDPRCDPVASAGRPVGGVVGGAVRDPNCPRPWCYVDAKSCMKFSAERVHRSEYFTREDGVNLFYSYTACDPTADDWSQVEPSKRTLGGMTIEVAVPTYMDPFMYKRNATDNEILTSTGMEYYNDSVPYEGVLVDYLERLMSIADGDFSVNYTYGSRSSRRMHPTSSFTAAVQDIGDGLVDAAIGPVWITGQRLQIASFTAPLYYDRTLLVIKNPVESVNDQIQKVLDPLEPGVWGLILALIIFTALLSVWFSDRHTLARKRYTHRRIIDASNPTKLRKWVYVRLALDDFIQKGTFFASAGVEQDVGGNLSQKILLFGFSFFTLIVVSAYVANLAAFLTRSVPSYIGTMEGVQENGLSICAAPSLEPELRAAWPGVNFVFSKTMRDYKGVLEDYDADLCEVLAVSHTQMSPNLELTTGLCERNLVFTQSLVIENPVAIPIRPELAPALTYWIYQGKKYHGITLEESMKKYDTGQSICGNLDFSAEDGQANDFAKIKVQNLYLPLIFFLSCAFVASIVQLYHRRALSRGNTDYPGRLSSLGVSSILLKDSVKQNAHDDDDQGETPQNEPGVPSSTCSMEGSIEGTKGTMAKVNSRLEEDVQCESFHENGDNSESNRANENIRLSSRGSAVSRLGQLMQTGALDEFFDNNNESGRQKEN